MTDQNDMNDQTDEMKKDLIDDVQETETEQPKEVTISEALRMHSGYVRVRGGMISGSRKAQDAN